LHDDTPKQELRINDKSGMRGLFKVKKKMLNAVLAHAIGRRQ